MEHLYSQPLPTYKLHNVKPLSIWQRLIGLFRRKPGKQLRFKVYFLDPTDVTPGQYFLFSYSMAQQRVLTGSDIRALREAYERGWYKYMADFTFNDQPGLTTKHWLDLILRMTQNGVLSPSWSKETANSHMTFVAPLKARSDGELLGHRQMALGDIIEGPDGKRYLCSTFGFKEVIADERLIEH